MSRKVVKKFAWLPILAIFPRFVDSKGIAWLRYVYCVQNGQKTEVIFTHKPTAMQQCSVLNTIKDDYRKLTYKARKELKGH